MQPNAQPHAPALAKPVKLVFGEYVENYVAEEPTADMLREWHLQIVAL